MNVAVVGVVALAVGTGLGRVGSGAAGDATPPATTAGRTNLIEPIDPVTATRPPVSTISTVTLPSGTALTAPPTGPDTVRTGGGVFAGSAVAVAAAVAGQPIEIVAVGNGRRLMRLDLATGQYRDRRAPVPAFGRPSVLAVDDLLLFPPSDPSLPTSVLAGDGSVREVDIGAADGLLGAPTHGLWQIEAVGGTPTGVTPISVDGERLAPTIPVPGPPMGFDPAGGVLVRHTGGTYSLGPSDRRRITSGALVALDATTAVAVECDETLRCATVTIDRADGTRQQLRVDGGAVGALPGATIGADGRHAIVHVTVASAGSSSQPTLGVIDLTSGELTEVGPAQNIDEATWTPDGRFVLYNAGGRIVAYDPVSGESVRVADELIAIDTFEIRPSR